MDNHRSLRKEQEWTQGAPCWVLCFPGDPGPLSGRVLPLACDSTPPPQLYFRPRRSEKAISQEALTSMLGTGRLPFPLSNHLLFQTQMRSKPELIDPSSWRHLGNLLQDV